MMNTHPSQTPSETSSETLSINEAVALLGISRPTLDKLVERGLLTKYRQPGGWHVYFLRAEVAKLKSQWRKEMPDLIRDHTRTLVRELYWHNLVDFVDAVLEDPAGNTSGDPSTAGFEIATMLQMTGARLERAVDRVYKKWQTQTQVPVSFTREQVKQLLLSALVDLLEWLAWSPKDKDAVTASLDADVRPASCKHSAHYRACLPSTTAWPIYRIDSIGVG